MLSQCVVNQLYLIFCFLLNRQVLFCYSFECSNLVLLLNFDIMRPHLHLLLKYLFYPNPLLASLLSLQILCFPYSIPNRSKKALLIGFTAILNGSTNCMVVLFVCLLLMGLQSNLVSLLFINFFPHLQSFDGYYL